MFKSEYPLNELKTSRQLTNYLWISDCLTSCHPVESPQFLCTFLTVKIPNKFIQNGF